MRTRQEKGDFFATLKHEIKNRETLRQFFNTTFQNVLNTFNGKVYNKRFETALQDAMQKVSPLMWAKCSIQSRSSYSNFPDSNTVQIEMRFRNSQTNYTDTENFYTNIVLKSDDKYNLRIDAESSRKERFTIAWAENFDKETEQEKEILKKYDKFLKVAEAMEKVVEEYNDLPQRFRQNMCTKYIHI